MRGPTYARPCHARSERGETPAITSELPITGRPSGWPANTASEARSWTRSCGLSSTIAISSSTTSRSESTSVNVGENAMSVIASSASGRWPSGMRV